MTKKVRIEIDGELGRVCVFSGTDRNVVDDPFADISRVLHHSLLKYPSVIQEWSGQVNFVEDLTREYIQRATILFPHGMPGIPMVQGVLTKIGAETVSVALAASVPVQVVGQHGRMVCIGADATNVLLFDNVQLTGVNRNFTVEVTAYVFDVYLPA